VGIYAGGKMKLKEPYLLCPVCGKIVAEYGIDAAWVTITRPLFVSSVIDGRHIISKSGFSCPELSKGFDSELPKHLLGVKSIMEAELSKVGHKVGDTVRVADAKRKNSIWQFAFNGTVTDIRDNGNLIIEDQDSDFYEVEPDELEKK
jgi:hypothetical protein